MEAPQRKLGLHSEAITIALQPYPHTTSLIVTPDGRWSSVVRKWHPGETARCRLCPAGTCTADDDNECHLVFEGKVAPRDAPLKSSLGLARQDDAAVR